MKMLNSKDIIRELKNLKSDLDEIKDKMEITFEAVISSIHKIRRDNDILDSNNLYGDMKDCIDLLVEANDKRQDWLDENLDTINELETACDEGSSINSEWNRGAELIHESDFEDYVHESEYDIHDFWDKIPDYIVIDWKETARNLLNDYATIHYNNKKYFLRRD